MIYIINDINNLVNFWELFSQYDNIDVIDEIGKTKIEFRKIQNGYTKSCYINNDEFFYKKYYNNDHELSRLDGPAIKQRGDIIKYFINDIEYSFDEYLLYLLDYNKTLHLKVMLKYS